MRVSIEKMLIKNVQLYQIGNEEDAMAISYNKLWKLLIDKKMSASELKKSS